MTTVFHVSDLHFGWPAVPEQIEAIEQIIHDAKFDVVVVSGDLTQRARAGEFQRAAAFRFIGRRLGPCLGRARMVRVHHPMS